MHAYMESIGFTKYISREQLVAMLQNILEHQEDTDYKEYVRKDGVKSVEIKTYYGDGIGIIWSGYMTEEKSFVLEYIVPFADGGDYISVQEPSIERKKDDLTYLGMCDDIRIGVSIIFQVLNSQDCMKHVESGNLMNKPGIAFSGLSNMGSVLLPISKSKEKKDDLETRYELLNAAKSGDEKAIETLTIEDIDTYAKLSKRIMHEDVFTIVDSSFMPYGLECDLYMIIGDIYNVEKTINILTKEVIYILGISCNDFRFSLAINAKTLVGEPKPGRRFKGNVWLQGHIKEFQ